MAGDRTRFTGKFHTSYIQSSSPTMLAADEIIITPEKHLLTQEQLLWAEGGYGGIASQVGSIAIGLGLLRFGRPAIFTYLKNGQLRMWEWGALAGTSFLSYQVGHCEGVWLFGDSQKVRNHWIAYSYVKQLNRFEGRYILTKKHMY